LTSALVEQLLRNWVESPQRGGVRFTLQTDEAALEHLRKNLRVAGARRGAVLQLDLTKPEAAQQAPLRTDLLKPINHGSLYLRAVLDNPAAYGVRAPLVQHTIHAFFNLMWNKKTLAKPLPPPSPEQKAKEAAEKKDKKQQGEEKNDVVTSKLLADRFRLVVLDGKALQEKAWINFRGNSHCESEKRAPLFTPRSSGKSATSVFVNHPAAAAAWRHRLASFFAAHANKQGVPVSAKSLFLRMRRRGLRNMELAAEVVGSNVPYYTVTVE